MTQDKSRIPESFYEGTVLMLEQMSEVPISLTTHCNEHSQVKLLGLMGIPISIA